MATPRRRSSRNRQPPPDPSTASKTTDKLAPVVELEDAIGLSDDMAMPSESKTPTRSAAPRASMEEMHPSMFQSTAKKLASEERFGFDAIANASTPTKQKGRPSVPQSVPPKPTANPFASPSFEFRFKRPSSELSSEAQRLMDQVREQAALIKTQLSAQRQEQNRKDGEADTLFGTRKFATPKGKLGRFSDVHSEHFKQMESIANHPSAYRADSSRPSTKKSLKRTKSNAELDKIDSAPQTPSKTPTKTTSGEHESQGRAKRLKSNSKASVPVSKTDQVTPSRLPTSDRALAQQHRSDTPTKSSTRGIASHKLPAPAIPQTPSKKLDIASRLLPSVPQTDPSNKRRSLLAGKLQSVRSILRKPQRRFSNDPIKQAAGTHMAVPGLTQGASTPSKADTAPGHTSSTPSTQLEKHVNFSPTPQVFGDSLRKPSKSASPLKSQVSYPDVAALKSPAAKTGSKQRDSGAPPSDPKNFTFRAGTAISFAQPSQQPATPNARKTSSRSNALTTDTTPRKLGDLPTIPHGLSNKKRKRANNDEVTEDKENHGNDEDMAQQSPSKRAKIVTGSPVKMPPSKRLPEGSPKKKSVLSLSRLNQLAAPKRRG